MSNPQTIDRRDVADATNPVGGHVHVEEIDQPNRAKPLDAKAAKLTAGGSHAAMTGSLGEALNEQPDAGMPHKIPQARSGHSGAEAKPAAPNETNPRRLDQTGTEGCETAHVQSPGPAD